MQMTEVRDKLQALQEVLSEKYDIENKLREAPSQLDAQNELLSRYKKGFLENNSVYDECKERVAKLEVELREAEKSREEGEKGMDNISSHREYEALDKQISEATAKEAEIRKELDKEKRTLSELDDNLNTDKAMIDAQEAEVKSLEASIDKQKKKFEAQLEKLAKREAEVTKDIDIETVYKFQRIIQRNSVGIVAVKNGVCEGCHMILPAQFANEVHDGDKILFCPYCSRILFYQESDDEEDYSTMLETGSLADDEFEDDDNISDDDEYSDENGFDKTSDYDSDEESDEEDSEEEESEEN
ncbi:MAG: nucleic acid-binding protein [Treponema sp.]|nr:nucleic acid-binding protein [Candidatus Treponema merdequi]